MNRPEGYLPIPPAGSYRHGLPAPRGGGRRRGAPGGGGPFEGWPCATPPCEERGAEHDATSTFQQTMTGEFRAGHGRLRSRTGRRDQADATTGGRRGGTECSAGGATLADRRECGLPVEGPDPRLFPQVGRELHHSARTRSGG